MDGSAYYTRAGVYLLIAISMVIGCTESRILDTYSNPDKLVANISNYARTIRPGIIENDPGAHHQDV